MLVINYPHSTRVCHHCCPILGTRMSEPNPQKRVTVGASRICYIQLSKLRIITNPRQICRGLRVRKRYVQITKQIPARAGMRARLTQHITPELCSLQLDSTMSASRTVTRASALPLLLLLHLALYPGCTAVEDSGVQPSDCPDQGIYMYSS